MPDEKQESQDSSKNENPKLPEANFAQLVFLLGAQAMQQLGMVPNPLDGKIRVDLQVAKFSIDLLNILQERTKGNLSLKEEQMLEDLLFDLRMRFVTASKEQDKK